MSAGSLAVGSSTFDLKPFFNFPAAVPPNGVKANFVNPTRQALDLFVPTSIFTSIMLLCLACRVWCIIRVSRQLRWDDVACFIGALGSIVAYVGSVHSCTVGSFGYQQYDLRVGQLLTDATMIDLFVFTWGTTVAVVFIKISFFLMFWNIFGQLRWVRISLLVGGTTFTVVNGVLGAALLYSQTPSPGQTWLAHVGTWIDQVVPTRLAVPTSAVGLAADIFVLVVPILAVRGLNMAPRRKWGIHAVFLAGIFACIASAMNTYSRLKISGSTNASIDIKDVFIFSTVECSIGVCCACAPSISKISHGSPLWTWLQKFKRVLIQAFSICNGRARASDRSTVTYHDSKAVPTHLSPHRPLGRGLPINWRHLAHILPRSLQRTTRLTEQTRDKTVMTGQSGTTVSQWTTGTATTAFEEEATSFANISADGRGQDPNLSSTDTRSPMSTVAASRILSLPPQLPAMTSNSNPVTNVTASHGDSDWTLSITSHIPSSTTEPPRSVRQA